MSLHAIQYGQSIHTARRPECMKTFTISDIEHAEVITGCNHLAGRKLFPQLGNAEIISKFIFHFACNFDEKAYKNRSCIINYALFSTF
jgi:hypothetical protein